ncbi:MAG: hypothetical protein IKQ18_00230 [Clostridia bacterium]|nr:hypothetical protein [Clostridia bacterium]
MKNDIMSYCGDEVLDAADKNWDGANKKSKFGRFAVVAAAALVGAGLIAAFAVAMAQRNVVTPPPDTADVLTTVTDATTDSSTEDDNYVRTDSDFGLIFTKSKGSESVYVVSGKAGGGAEAAPPKVEFRVEGIIVKVKQKSVHEDTFTMLSDETKYRLMSFEVLNVVRGENVPDTILCLVPEYYFVDMSGYEFLYMSLAQRGFEGFLMKDVTTNELCGFQSPVFTTTDEEFALGDVIAFNNGVFDESLWQNENWFYGYQFARYMMEDYPDELVVKRGCTEQYMLDRIKEKLGELQISEKDAPVVFYAATAPEELKAALEYVNSGTFRCEMHGKQVWYQRYINGCPTNESFYIRLIDNTVKYGNVTFTEADINGLYNLGAEVERLSAQYKENVPNPPHFDPGEKELLSLKVEGYYDKTDKGVLQFITTTWTYFTLENNTYYYDQTFTIYENKEAREISREDLSELTGHDMSIIGENYKYGEGIEMPWC